MDLDRLYHADSTRQDGDSPEYVFGFEVRFTIQRGPRRRFRFEPRQSGPGWWRFENEWVGCRWRPVGREVVDHVDLRVTLADQRGPHER
ncbi:hypothetical protein Z052_05840 [Halorubrum sp. C191]|uniref:Uncharacterized protein n=1 Tax=Halorubrum ezzemoulense TaxID=337243 RepID=A0A256KE88_HALEZ|nr:hypothetical protein DJ84_18205 [Halorubrum ezzemoulense]PHQ43106.1 hypothetical protein Z052_05840 [Halorubrum sp. C191]QAY18855.1 hypothetical protein EO776_01845 [Halorubrum ezzemoulense]TKX41316.1 hypothetical protein EXE52_03875 [Halorubrum sp. CGM4_25_10-8A]TKX63945.1 hypothetical protein EXE47_13380 [Halorubrum sp. GN12_10-3_MGM]